MGAAIEPSTEKIATRVAYGKSLVELAKLNQDTVPLAILPETTALSATSTGRMAPLAMCSPVIEPDAI